MQKKTSIILLALITLFLSSTAQTKKNKKVKILPVPAIGYSPETKTYVGAVSLFTLDFYNDSITRKSTSKLEFNYTWNNQLILESGWNYFFREEKWYSEGRIRYSKFPELYYGIGSNTPTSNETFYSSKRIEIETALLKQVYSKTFLGPIVKYKRYYDVELDENVELFPELTNNYVFGLGFNLLHDSRNSLLTPTSGKYMNLSSRYNISESNYVELTIDIRFYKSWNKKFTWSNRVLNDFCFGEPAFFDMGQIGGDQFVRGYYLGRYRDKNISTWQSEFRFPFFRRNKLAVFTGLSNVYSGENPIKLSNTKYNYGFGMRFLVDKTDNTYLRLDYGIGQDQNDGFYISFGESF